MSSFSPIAGKCFRCNASTHNVVGEWFMCERCSAPTNEPPDLPLKTCLQTQEPHCPTCGWQMAKPNGLGSGMTAAVRLYCGNCKRFALGVFWTVQSLPEAEN